MAEVEVRYAETRPLLPRHSSLAAARPPRSTGGMARQASLPCPAGVMDSGLAASLSALGDAGPHRLRDVVRTRIDRGDHAIPHRGLMP